MFILVSESVRALSAVSVRPESWRPSLAFGVAASNATGWADNAVDGVLAGGCIVSVGRFARNNISGHVDAGIVFDSGYQGAVA